MSFKKSRTLYFWLFFSIITIVSYQNCNNNKLNFDVADSTKAGPNDCEFDDTFVRNGESIDAFALSSVPIGHVCVSEKRTCNKGYLSGKYLFSKCEIGVPKSCILDNKTISHLNSIAAYSATTVPFGSSCSQVMQIRTCIDGLLNGGGQYTYTTCNVAPETTKLPCTKDGITITSGQSSNFYQKRSVPYGQQCLPQTRTCSNGTLSGNYEFSSCSSGSVQTDTFQYTQQQTSQPLDIIIALDNSGSMSEEASHVQKNLTALINSIKDRPDIQVGVISDKNSIFGIDLKKIFGTTELSNRFQQAEQNVQSQNALLCIQKHLKSSQTTFQPEYPQIARLNESFAQENYYCNYPSIRNFTSDFLRTNSYKVLIVVSDDKTSYDLSFLFPNNYQVSTIDFFSYLNQSYFNTPYHSGPDNLTFFGFIGLGEASPCQASRGLFYEKLALETNGKVFNICDTDWSQHFNTITNAALLINSSSMQLTYSATSILEVKIDGNIISNTNYQIFGKYIKLDSNKLNLINGKKYNISVKYAYN